MKKKDIYLITTIFVVALISFITLQVFQSRSALDDGLAVVTYQNREILHIDLKDGSYTVLDSDGVIEIKEEDYLYIVHGDNGPVTILYQNHKVSVIDEESPRNICQYQGETNSPLRPLTCLPNDVVILIRSQVFDPDDDDVIIQ